MPVFEYYCKSCNSQFEELLLSKVDSEKYKDSYRCACGQIAKRVPSVVNHTFKGGVPGNSGSHDIDYPSLDKAVGRSADKKWARYNKRKEERDKIRKKAGTSALTVSGNKVAPTSPQKMELREKALKAFNVAKSNTSDK